MPSKSKMNAINMMPYVRYYMINKFTVILSLLAVVLICLLSNCNNSNCSERPSFEKAQFIIQLENTKLLVSELERDLDEPWEVTWGGDDHLWFTEKKGNIMRMNTANGKVKIVLTVPEVYSEGFTPGLLGLVLHPDFNNAPFVYMHYTYIDSTITGEFDRRGNPNYVRSRLVRYKYSSQTDSLISPEILVPEITGSRAHNGSRLAISNDNKLLLAIGDASNSKNAQTSHALPGKVLRINLDGSVPDDNPIPGSFFYSMGHRNPQGLVAANGKIYASEHGPDNDDEINLIQPGGNYGWPYVEGYCDKENERAFCDSVSVTPPIYSWTPTIAPAGLDYYNHEAIPEWKNHLMLATLKGKALWLFELDEQGETIEDSKIYLQKQFGRLRDLCVSSSGDIYVVTSNSDWHIPRYEWMYDNVPAAGNDRVLKISALHDYEEEKYNHLKTFREDQEPIQMFLQADTPEELLYMNNCVSCHLRYGQGIADFTPPLRGTATVADKNKLIETVLFGMSGEIEVLGKKYNEIMPGYAASLTNEELRDILNYVRSRGSSATDSITVAEIDVIRKTQTF